MPGAYCPDWYNWLRIADRLHIPVTELHKLPAYWHERALIADRAETAAEEFHTNQALNRSGPGYERVF